jgi:hypothetical protein
MYDPPTCKSDKMTSTLPYGHGICAFLADTTDHGLVTHNIKQAAAYTTHSHYGNTPVNYHKKKIPQPSSTANEIP